MQWSSPFPLVVFLAVALTSASAEDISCGSHGYAACTCFSGYSGSDCSIPVMSDVCPQITIFNGGTCTEGFGGPTITCPPQYTGPGCANDVDECGSSPCLNGGVCQNLYGSFGCTCSPQWTSTLCDVAAPPVALCSDHPVQNGGTCVDGQFGPDYSCVGTGYTGLYCADDVNECAQGEGESSCPNGGICTNLPGTFSCTPPVALCADHPVQNGGTCTDGPYGPSYDCIGTGYNGLYCSNDVNECGEDGGVTPCQNGGVCTNLPGSFSCACSSPYKGTTCQTHYDNCAEHVVLNGGTCIDTPFGRDISCVGTGYNGMDCAFDVNECGEEGISVCPAGTACVNTPGSFTCV
jgi:Notch-like protein